MLKASELIRRTFIGEFLHKISYFKFFFNNFINRVGQPKDIVYQCDICSKMRPTKRSLFNHMRNVHRVRETPCNVCGKVFRTPALLQKHMMYHDETKRVHRCPMCPDKPGWFTNVALKRHQKSHHLGMKEYQCDAEYCDAAFT